MEERRVGAGLPPLAGCFGAAAKEASFVGATELVGTALNANSTDKSNEVGLEPSLSEITASLSDGTVCSSVKSIIDVSSLEFSDFLGRFAGLASSSDSSSGDEDGSTGEGDLVRFLSLLDFSAVSVGL